MTSPMKNILCVLSIFVIFLLRFTCPQNIAKSSFVIDGPIQDIVWCGQEEVSDATNMTQPIYLKKIVFVVSGKGTVYRSIDEGRNFENIRSRLETLSETLARYVKEKEHTVTKSQNIFKKNKFLIRLEPL